MATLKEMARDTELLTGGHRMCAGCAAPIIVRQILHAANSNPVVVGCATGCLEVATTIYPYTAWKCNFIHNAFENSAATVSGVESAYRSLKSKGKLKTDKEIKFIAFGGDGGTYDIGLQSLSGAMERGHNMMFVCYNNGAYMNTGIQRSSATPRGASTTTAPAGDMSYGKTQYPKDLTGILIAHNIKYVGQASPSNWRDLTMKVQKALTIDGPTFLNVISPCPPGWRHPTDETIEIAKLAIETCFWPLYEVENDEWKLNYKPKEIKPVREFIEKQGRFGHLKKPENATIIDEIQEQVNADWEKLLTKCGISA